MDEIISDGFEIEKIEDNDLSAEHGENEDKSQYYIHSLHDSSGGNVHHHNDHIGQSTNNKNRQNNKNASPKKDISEEMKPENQIQSPSNTVEKSSDTQKNNAMQINGFMITLNNEKEIQPETSSNTDQTGKYRQENLSRRVIKFDSSPDGDSEEDDEEKNNETLDSLFLRSQARDSEDQSQANEIKEESDSNVKDENPGLHQNKQEDSEKDNMQSNFESEEPKKIIHERTEQNHLDVEKTITKANEKEDTSPQNSLKTFRDGDHFHQSDKHISDQNIKKNWNKINHSSISGNQYNEIQQDKTNQIDTIQNHHCNNDSQNIELEYFSQTIGSLNSEYSSSEITNQNHDSNNEHSDHLALQTQSGNISSPKKSPKKNMNSKEKNKEQYIVVQLKTLDNASKENLERDNQQFDLEKYNKLYDELETKLTHEIRKRRELERSIQQYERELKQIATNQNQDETNQDLKNQYTQLYINYSKIESSFKELKSRYQQLKSLYERQNNNDNNSKSQIQELQKDNQFLQNKYDNLKDQAEKQLKSANQKIRELETTIHSLRTENRTLKRQLSERPSNNRNNQIHNRALTEKQTANRNSTNTTQNKPSTSVRHYTSSDKNRAKTNLAITQKNQTENHELVVTIFQHLNKLVKKGKITKEDQFYYVNQSTIQQNQKLSMLMDRVSEDDIAELVKSFSK